MTKNVAWTWKDESKVSIWDVYREGPSSKVKATTRKLVTTRPGSVSGERTGDAAAADCGSSKHTAQSSTSENTFAPRDHRGHFHRIDLCVSMMRRF
jgi:hypothetical protein